MSRSGRLQIKELDLGRVRPRGPSPRGAAGPDTKVANFFLCSGKSLIAKVSELGSLEQPCRVRTWLRAGPAGQTEQSPEKAVRVHQSNHSLSQLRLAGPPHSRPSASKPEAGPQGGPSADPSLL